MNGIHIAGFSISVADLDRSVEFYTRGLGLLEKGKEDHGDLHEVIVGSEHHESVILLVNDASLSAPPVPSNDLDKIVLMTDDAVATYERALALGGTPVDPPRAFEEAGVIFAHVRDPDGHVIELVEHHA
jgi:lactoylglutathione lyase